MPKRNDIKSILILGSGPIIIGQACEFDYSGAQACKALKEEGYKIILVNSNPATIMTDPDIADLTFIEPIHWKIIKKIIEKENPDAILPTMGGQTALNCILDLEKHKVFKKFNIELIGISIKSIKKAENRNLFKNSMRKISIPTTISKVASNIDESFIALQDIGFPCIIRSFFSLGGEGSGIAYNKKEFYKIIKKKFNVSSTSKVIIDQFLLGWKEYELEAIKDMNGNCIIVCSIENIDPVGIHTGDSITVAPIQTLTDREYQILRNSTFFILEEIGVKNGGANVQFAVNPKNGEFVVIEMNPRISRSSALASKATGFPISKISAKLAVGYTLDELKNDITGTCIPASFEPSIDYVITKIPRFDFDRFPGSNDRLTTEMKSVGEVMGIGRTQQESFQKALISLELNLNGFNSKFNNLKNIKSIKKIKWELKNPGWDRILYVGDAIRIGMSIHEISNLTNIDCWFLLQIKELIDIESNILLNGLSILNKKYLFFLKSKGFSDKRLSFLFKISEENFKKIREDFSIFPVYKKIDSCAGEFKNNASYMYSTYENECESNPSNNIDKVIIVGGGPIRIGQGIEFDYCCVHASQVLKKCNYETIMINCNPETISTDYDISNRLYFEPITLENILNVCRIEKPKGIILQFGGQTPLKLSSGLKKNNIKILGSKYQIIDICENRKSFKKIIKKLHLKQPKNTTVLNLNRVLKKSEKIGYPIIIRPSYVIGGQKIKIFYTKKKIQDFLDVQKKFLDFPLLLEKFLFNAVEIDVDAICDTKNVLICGIIQHVERAGIHSGDSSCSYPPYSLNIHIQSLIKSQTKKIALKLQILGFLNIQFAIYKNCIYVLEVNPRSSRTIPFLSKAIGIRLVEIATKVIIGIPLLQQNINIQKKSIYAVKKSVFPFNKFFGFSPVLGPEMLSTGEVMSFGKTFSEAFAKTILADNILIKKKKYVLFLIYQNNKINIIKLAKMLKKFNFKLETNYKINKILLKERITSYIISDTDNSVFINIKKSMYQYIIYIYDPFFKKNNFSILEQAVKYKIYYDTSFSSSFATLLSFQSNPYYRLFSLQNDI